MEALDLFEFKFCNGQNTVISGALLTFKEDLGRENLNGLFTVAKMLNCGIVQHMLVWLLLQDCLLAPNELLLGILLQISCHHGSSIKILRFDYKFRWQTPLL